MRDSSPTSFDQIGAASQRGLLGELYEYFKSSRKLWLVPLFLVLLAMGALIVLGSTAAAPFIYTLL
jgi:hypothetical protein